MNLLRISQYIKRFIYVYLTTLPGGYRKRKLQILKEMFEKSVHFMNQIGLEYWLDFGTLLGYFREKGIIPHDIDVDYSMASDSYEKIVKLKHLLPEGFQFYDTSYKHHGPKLYMNYKGFDVDIYFYADLGAKMQSTEKARFINERQEIPKSLIYPLQNDKLFGLQVMVPNQVKNYLEFIYGYIGTPAKRDVKTGFWVEP